MPVTKLLEQHIVGTSRSDANTFGEHEFVIFLNDIKSGLKAFVAVHSTLRGPAHGGTRMKGYKNEKEALDDALRLSKAMSYKSALAGLPYGGAKGVIMFDNNLLDRKAVLRAYAKKLEQLNGLFQTGTDVGLTDSDTTYMAKYSGYILGLPKIDKSQMTTSSAAARGVFYSMRAAAKHRYGSESLAGRVIGVKGVGKLGGELVGLLLAAGAKVILADTDESKLALMRTAHPEATIVPVDEIHKQVMHIFAPCALGSEFNSRTVKQLRCDMVVGGANNQLENDRAGEALHEAGIIYVPDYVANAGGLIFVSEDLEQDGFHEQRIKARLKNIPKTVSTILERSRNLNKPTYWVADQMARDRIWTTSK